MSNSVMISLLSKGNTGTQILEILNSIVEETNQQPEPKQPTLNTIEFWSHREDNLSSLRHNTIETVSINNLTNNSP
jgi:hypothetical protein